MTRVAELPKRIREKPIGKLTKGDLVAVHSLVDLFTLIRATNVHLWLVLGPALATKRRMGFCAMSLSCSNKTDGKHRGCTECRKRAREIREAARDRDEPSRRLTPYQQWRRQGAQP